MGTLVPIIQPPLECSIVFDILFSKEVTVLVLLLFLSHYKSLDCIGQRTSVGFYLILSVLLPIKHSRTEELTTASLTEPLQDRPDCNSLTPSAPTLNGGPPDLWCLLKSVSV